MLQQDSTLTDNADLKPASKEEAEQYAEQSIMRNTQGEQFPVCSSSPSDFSVHSIGLELYFLFVKEMFIVFLVMGVLAIPPIVINYYGDQLEQMDVGTVFDKSTLANQKGVGYQTTSQAAADEAVEDNKNIEYVTIYFDVGSCAVFLVMLWIFRMYNYGKELNSKKRNLTPEGYSVQVFGIPPDFSQKGREAVTEVKNFFEERFGPVAECSLAKNFQNCIGQQKQLADLAREIRKEQIRCQLAGKPSSSDLEELQKKRETTLENLKKSFPDAQDYDHLPINRAFIIFDNPDDRRKCLTAYNRCTCLGCIECACCQSSQLRFQGCPLTVTKVQAPSDILWENLDATVCGKIFRGILSFICVVILLILSYFAIFAIQREQSSLPTYEECLNYPTITLALAKVETNQKVIDCFCANADKMKISTDSDYIDVCSDFLKEYYTFWALYILCILVIAVINVTIKYALYFLSKFEKYATVTEEQTATMKKLFISMSVNLILLLLFSNLNFQDTSFFEWIYDNVPLGKYFFSGDYKDFTRLWHVKVGVTIIILMLVTVFWPQVMDFIFWYPWKRCRRCCTGNVVLQSDLNKIYEGYEFTLWDRYAYILAVIFFVFAFSPGLPLLLPLGCGFCFIIYWIDKYLLLRFYKKPPSLSSKINTRAFDILPFAVLIHAILALFIYTCPEIYPQDTTSTSSLANGSAVYSGESLSFIERFFTPNGIPFLIIILIMVAYIVIRFLISTFRCILCRSKKILNTEDEELPFHQVEETMKVNHLTSYRIEKNPEYATLLHEMWKISHEEGKIHHEISSPINSNEIDPAVGENEKQNLKG